MKAIAVLTIVVLTGCGASTASSSAATSSGAAEPPVAASEPATNPALADDSREAVCETLRIVDEEIRATYEKAGFPADDFPALGAAVAKHGADIVKLADALSDEAVAAMIIAVGEGYIEEGGQVAGEDPVTGTASEAVTDLVIAYGDLCELT